MKQSGRKQISERCFYRVRQQFFIFIFLAVERCDPAPTETLIRPQERDGSGNLVAGPMLFGARLLAFAPGRPADAVMGTLRGQARVRLAALETACRPFSRPAPSRTARDSRLAAGLSRPPCTADLSTVAGPYHARDCFCAERAA